MSDKISISRDLLERILDRMVDDFFQIDQEWGDGSTSSDEVNEIRELREILDLDRPPPPKPTREELRAEVRKPLPWEKYQMPNA